METIDIDLHGYYVKSVLDSSNTNFALVCNIGTGYLSEISRKKFDELFSRGLIHGVRSVGNEYSIKCYDSKEAILNKYIACLTLLRRAEGFSFNADGTGITVTGIPVKAKSFSIPKFVTAVNLSRNINSECALENLVVPDTVLSLEAGCFHHLIHLECVQLPLYVTELPSGLFRACKSLRDIHFPRKVIYYGFDCFACTGIQGISITDLAHGDVVEVCSGAFEDSDLESVDIPLNAKLGSSVFAGCKNLREVCFTKVGSKRMVTLPNSIFRNCSSLKTVELPDGLLLIEDYCFSGCNLDLLEIPESVSKIYFCAFLYSRIKILKIKRNTIITIPLIMKVKFGCLEEFSSNYAEKLFTDAFLERVRGILQIDELIFLD